MSLGRLYWPPRVGIQQKWVVYRQFCMSYARMVGLVVKRPKTRFQNDRFTTKHLLAAFTPGSPAARSSGPSALKALTALTYCCLSPGRPVLGCPPTGRHLSPPTRRFLSPTIGRCLSLCPGLQHSSHSLPSHCCLSLRTCEHRCNGIWDNANMAWTTRASSVRDPHCWLLVHCLGRRLLDYQLA